MQNTVQGLYGLMEIPRADKAKREAQDRRNFEFFGAPVVFFVFVQVRFCAVILFLLVVALVVFRHPPPRAPVLTITPAANHLHPRTCTSINVSTTFPQ